MALNVSLEMITYHRDLDPNQYRAYQKRKNQFSVLQLLVFQSQAFRKLALEVQCP